MDQQGTSKGGIMSLYEKASPELKKKADEFIKNIEDHTLVKRTLSNASGDYPVEKALESFKSLAGSKEMEEIMIDAYK